MAQLVSILPSAVVEAAVCGVEKEGPDLAQLDLHPSDFTSIKYHSYKHSFSSLSKVKSIII